jgi:hypothetical protein
VTVSPSPTDPEYVATFEDWYQIIIGTAETLNITLDFPGTGADIDMYLFSLENNTSTIIHASSTADNIGLGSYNEEINKFLSSGTYYVAVDAFNTPGNQGGYTLKISTDDDFIDICDWFSFSLPAQSQVTLKVTGGSSFVLMDAAAVNTLANGGPAETSITLSAGSYLIGVGEGGPYTLEVSSP